MTQTWNWASCCDQRILENKQMDFGPLSSYNLRMEDISLYTPAEMEKLNLTSDSSFEDCEFQGVDFTLYNLKSVSFVDCTFSHCNFANLSLMNTSIRGGHFKTCNLMGVNWCNLRRFDPGSFSDCKLNYSSFQELKLKKIKILNCSAVDVDFSGADLNFADFSNTTFAGANFNGANLIGCDFRSSRDYIFDLRTTKIKDAKFSFPHVIALITALGADVEI